MEQNVKTVDHAYIVSKEGFYGGRAVIYGTKFPVSSIVNYVLIQGMMPEELVREFAHLGLSQVYDALSYYYDHKEEIDKEMENNSEAVLSKEFGENIE